MRTLLQLEEELYAMQNGQETANPRKGKGRGKGKKGKDKGLPSVEAPPPAPSKSKKRKSKQKPSLDAPTELDGMTNHLKAMLWGPGQAHQMPVYGGHFQSPMHLATMPVYTPPWFPTAVVRQTGTVKKMVQGKGFGFISTDAYAGCIGDVFLHFSDVRGAGNAAEAIQVGSRLNFWVEIDCSTGRGRAKDVLILPQEAELPCVTRAQMMSVLASMKDELNTNKRPWFAKYGRQHRIHTMHWPDWLNEENRNLNDASLLIEMENRVSAENGADKNNHATFGKDSFRGGWSFKEAVKANEAIWELEGRTLVPWQPDEEEEEETLSMHGLEDLESTATEPVSTDQMTQEEWLEYISYSWVGEGADSF